MHRRSGPREWGEWHSPLLHHDLGWWQIGTSCKPGLTARLTALLKCTQSMDLLWREAASGHFQWNSRPEERCSFPLYSAKKLPVLLVQFSGERTAPAVFFFMDVSWVLLHPHQCRERGRIPGTKWRQFRKLDSADEWMVADKKRSASKSLCLELFMHFTLHGD